MTVHQVHLREVDGGCNIPLKVIPRSSKNMVLGRENGELKVKIQAPPLEGEANETLIGFMAKWLQCPRAHLRIVKGLRSRHKVVWVQGLRAPQVLAFVEDQINKRMENG